MAETAPASDLKPFEEHAADAGTPAWLVAAAKAYRDLPQGREMTRAAFDALVAEVSGLKISSR
jgi:hypothetical protein